MARAAVKSTEIPEAKIRQAIWMIKSKKTKKSICEHLGIAYNTKRLDSIIQIAPLAFMRGRTLDNAFVILDEAQNTTHNQMKMFLTRMGKNAKFMITGDPGQVDLPRRTISGLKEAILVLKDIEGIGIIYLDDKDIVRHKLVKKVIDAYKSIENLD